MGSRHLQASRGHVLGAAVSPITVSHIAGCEENVAAASGETDQSGIVFRAFSSFAVVGATGRVSFAVVGATGRVLHGRERGQDQRTFEFAVF